MSLTSPDQGNLPPVLRENGSRLDWGKKGFYSVKLQPNGLRADITVHHILRGAEGLDEALTDPERNVVYATEIRCPRTMFSKEEVSRFPTQKFVWDENDVVWGDSWMLTGVVSTKDTRLNTTGVHPSLYQGSKNVDVPAGWMLARGDVRRLKSLMQSLLLFRPDKKMMSGRMRVTFKATLTSPGFLVHMAEDLYERCSQDREGHSRDVLIAALVGVFSLMPSSPMAKGEDYAEHRITNELRDRLIEAVGNDWDSLNFDPLLAATAIESFIPKRSEVESSDE